MKIGTKARPAISRFCLEVGWPYPKIIATGDNLRVYTWPDEPFFLEIGCNGARKLYALIVENFDDLDDNILPDCFTDCDNQWGFTHILFSSLMRWESAIRSWDRDGRLMGEEFSSLMRWESPPETVELLPKTVRQTETPVTSQTG